MRIVHVIDLLIIGGAQKLLIYFAQEARRRGIEMEVVALRPNWSYSPFAEQLHELGVKVVTLHIKKLYDPRAIPALLKVIRKGRFDVVQTHLTHANILGVIAGRLAGLPVIATLHTTNESDLIGFFAFRRVVQRFTLTRLASRIVAVADSVAAAHQARLGKARIDVIPNAVIDPPVLTAEDRLALRRELLGDPDRFLILAVGRLIADKGFSDLIDAFALVLQQFPSAYLVIAGDGELREDLTQQVRQRGLEHSIGLAGSRDDVARIMVVADLYASSSHREGLSIALLEAMSAGLPIVATSVGDTSVLLADGRGVLVQPKNVTGLAGELSRMLSEPDARIALGRAAREYVQANYNLDLWMNRLLDLYRQEVHS